MLSCLSKDNQANVELQTPNNDPVSFYIPVQAGETPGWLICIPHPNTEEIHTIQTNTQTNSISLKDIFRMYNVRTNVDLQASEFYEKFASARKNNPGLQKFDFRARANQWISLHTAQILANDLNFHTDIRNAFSLHTHQNRPELRCFCDEWTGTSVDHLVQHFQNWHNLPIDPPPTCICGMAFLTFEALKNHQASCTVHIDYWEF